MTLDDVKSKICSVFMGLTEDDIVNKRFFYFNHLQGTGLGPYSLCLPSVPCNFEWNGRQVVSLAKSGAGFIHILASTDLPGCSDSLQAKVIFSYSCMQILCIFIWLVMHIGSKD